ncbi:DEHA2G01254p [Debaryomyces hansenii CBS767]|uniref:DEHA2G01254p n=1 Tax=Debaryomyces hansenii (strain ATCC 36239 / CBS 767 / BCRC 21394 / JCM 1990 / NBRC 0083 / IGC 2968) TaxID=284592 RepID=B5RV11_DEBHA|nr:DEHA2G01254p [Debaryomyces hansenii CBS767]CAR65890.1 DEHA2G01254p [Debaryomyces hansenii CBS767]|eukprot:XP_002770555.1 DEHA2G01254p [Debaryomyces hansenii CBS767]
MRISEKLSQAHSTSSPPPATFSFEFFVPKTSQGVQNLYDRMDRMYDLNPIFIDITWNAGGRSSSLTNEMVYTAQSTLGLETCMHLTCTNMKIELIDEALHKAYVSGCQNILALRGDPPLDGSESTGDFKYAKDLIRYIRNKYGDHFNIGVAAYPEGHPEEEDEDKTLQYLKEKCDAGANLIITQMFYDADNFIKWCSKLRKIGIDIPIIPGIMPISTYAAFIRRAKWSEVVIPQHFLDALEPIKEDDYLVRAKGTELVSEMCTKLIKSGYVNHLHFYTMNLERATIMILENLNLIESVKSHEVIGGSDLPWRKSLHPQRSKESIRPIFWQNRKYSYISRTSTWDEFPNGRWGDSRSPAFGDIDLFATDLLRQSPKKAFDLWGHPGTLKQFSDIIISFLSGKLNSLPWSDSAIGQDSEIIVDNLIALNKKGFFTLNSQPSLNAIKSNDKVYGWGPKNGYVYQKQYLEFFVHKDIIPALLHQIDNYNRGQGDSNSSVLTYYAVDQKGKLFSNTKDDDINAVTWGVFPGEEILQPTIVEKVSFLAWKDEVYRLITEWIKIFQSDFVKDVNITKEDVDAFVKLMTNFNDEYVLCNVVNNNFIDDNQTIFKLIDELNIPDLK